MAWYRRAAVGLGATALLVACGGPVAESPSATPTPGGTGTPSATSTPSETAAADPHPALADLVVSTSGLGPLTIGIVPELNPGAAMIAFDAEACAETLIGESDGEPGRWSASGYGPDSLAHAGSGPAFAVDVDPVRGVGWIDILGSSPHTADGLGVGSLLEDLQAAYPALQGPFDGPISRVWWVEDEHGILAFETELDGELGDASTGPERIELMRVLLPGTDPRFATAHSDWVAGGC